MAAVVTEEVALPDGRVLEVTLGGPPGAPAFLYHHGTPGSARPFRALVEAVLDRGWRYVGSSRAGYGTSSRREGRDVGGVVADTLAALDALGIGRFVTAGWSGGGPHALACAAGLPERCAAAASLSGCAPYAPGELDWTAGMAQDNVEEYGLALDGGPGLDEFLAGMRSVLVAMPDAVGSPRELFGDLVSDADDAAATPGFTAELIAHIRHGVHSGTGGWSDDDRAFFRPWGVELGATAVPVGIWFGTADHMVPAAHGEWLATHVPGAQRHRLEGHGHWSYWLEDPSGVLDGLAGLAGAPW